jgi:uncharacterized protein (DUF1697 family)
MADLKTMCADAGFSRIETYIASGNVVLECNKTAAKVQSELETRLRAFAGKTVGVLVRTAVEMEAVLTRNPFRDKESKYTHVFFLQEKPPSDALEHVRGRATEDLRLGLREIYVYYPSGMGQSKLRITAARRGTARNMNTVAKLVEMCLRS